jgi:hypothetical protein
LTNGLYCLIEPVLRHPHPALDVSDQVSAVSLWTSQNLGGPMQ